MPAIAQRIKVNPFEWKPFSRKQLKVLTWWTRSSPYRDWDGIICDGAIRSGKTVAMIDSFFQWSLSTFAGEAFIIGAKSMGALKRNVLKPLFAMLTAKGIPFRYHRSEHYIQIGSNTYYCFGASTEASQDVLQGLTAAGAYIDEVALLPQSFVEQAVARCSIDGAKVWMNCNPENPFHFVKTDFIDRALERRFLHLHFTMDDNLSLSERVKERYKRQFKGLWFKRMIDDLWVQAEGAIYDMFTDKHLIKPEDLPKDYDRYYIGVDYGTGNPTVFLLLGEFNRKLYLIKEYYHDGRNTSQKAPTQYSKDFREFIEKTPYYQAVAIDPSASSFILQLTQDGVRRKRHANNDVRNGIMDVANLLADKRLFVSTDCKHLIQEFQTYVWDPKAQERGEDTPIKQNDHCLDALRYIVRTFYPTRGRKAA
jgi:PBSX family phage terminase large subunit